MVWLTTGLFWGPQLHLTAPADATYFFVQSSIFYCEYVNQCSRITGRRFRRFGFLPLGNRRVAFVVTCKPIDGLCYQLAICCLCNRNTSRKQAKHQS